jgi:outer membrane protein assembly factor BamD (BamD/ComL family)
VAPAQSAAEPRAVSVPSRARSAGPPAPTPSAHDDSSDTASLSAELSLIETARTALREGRARDALAALDEHRSRFARGAFEEEAAVLRIEALAKAGDSATASRLARSFLDTRPHSPYASRVRRALASVGAEPQ